MVKSYPTVESGLAGTAKSAEHPADAGSASQAAFTSAAIGMGWQLAVIVLIPIFGGYKLDQILDTAPWLTVIGLILASVGSILVIRRALAAFGNFDVPAPAETPAKPVDDTSATAAKDTSK